MKYIAILFFIISPLVSAQDLAQKIRPASNTDFSGYWRVVLIPDNMHKQVENKSMVFSNPCQILIHKPDGTWHSLSIGNGAGDEEAKRQCPTIKKSLIDQVLLTQPASHFQWNKQPNQDGLFFVRDISVTDPNAISAFLWKADYVVEDFPSAGLIGFDLKQGEMLMQLTKPLGNNRFIPVWSMVLQPVRE